MIRQMAILVGNLFASLLFHGFWIGSFVAPKALFQTGKFPDRLHFLLTRLVTNSTFSREFWREYELFAIKFEQRPSQSVHLGCVSRWLRFDYSPLRLSKCLRQIKVERSGALIG